jgi:polyisoprenoid-binding protein YceI
MTNQTKWSIDPTHSDISFKIGHLMISNVKGSFKVFDASIYTVGDDFTTADIDVWIEARSISTGDAKRDEHLTGPDFFDVNQFQQIKFNSSAIGPADPDGNHVLWGELIIKGISNDIKLNVVFGGIATDPYGKEKAGFTITGKLRRKDYGLNWNTPLETGGILISDDVLISCEIELINLGQKDLLLDLQPVTDHKERTHSNK